MSEASGVRRWVHLPFFKNRLGWKTNTANSWAYILCSLILQLLVTTYCCCCYYKTLVPNIRMPSELLYGVQCHCRWYSYTLYQSDFTRKPYVWYYPVIEHLLSGLFLQNFSNFFFFLCFVMRNIFAKFLLFLLQVCL